MFKRFIYTSGGIALIAYMVGLSVPTAILFGLACGGGIFALIAANVPLSNEEIERRERSRW